MEIMTKEEMLAWFEGIGQRLTHLEASVRVLSHELRVARDSGSGEKGEEAPQAIFTREEAAAFLRVSVAQVDNWARSGMLRRVKIGEGPRSRVMYRREDLLGFLDGFVERGGEGDVDEVDGVDGVD